MKQGKNSASLEPLYYMVLGLLFLLVVCQPLNVAADQNDNAILTQVLQRHYRDGGFTVVRPESTLWPLQSKEPERVVKTKKHIIDKLKIEGYDLGPLLDKLIDKNKERVSLSLASSPGNGFIVDYDRKFKKYLDSNGSGWGKWYEDNPTAHGLTAVSLPVYDEHTQIVLIYIETQMDELGGVGYIVAYRYENDRLKELGRVRLWVS
jgi:hypothetical protein